MLLFKESSIVESVISMAPRLQSCLYRLRSMALVAVVACAMSACEDATGVQSKVVKPPPVMKSSFTCVVTVASQDMNCSETSDGASSSGVRANRIIGGQDIYIKLASSGTAYDAGTQILSSNVTVQNLAQTLMGTGDGVTVDGLSVFLVSEPVVSSGTGAVTVANPDGIGVFTGTNQPYFLYSEILEPYQISNSRIWQFSAPPTVDVFEFVVYVSVPVVDAEAKLVDAVWNGVATGDWFGASNWVGGSAPEDTSVVAIPRLSLLAVDAFQPEISADEVVSSLRVGEGSVLTLNGYKIEVTDNVDAPGSIANGTVRSTGASALIGGNFPALEVSGSARLQRPTVANGAVSVSGTLLVKDNPLTVVIPE